MIEAGELRHRVRFDRLMEAPDSSGDVQSPRTGALHETWVPVITVWAAIKPLSAREYRQSGAEQGEWMGNIVTRYLGLIADSANMRAVHVVDGVDAAIFNIAGPLADPRSMREYLTFPARTGVSDGR